MPTPIAEPLLRHQEAIAALCQSHGVVRLEVFGSAANGRFDPARSDVDLIASFAPEAQALIGQHYFELAEGLEKLLGCRVDLLTDQPIRNPYLRATVNASRRDLYVRAAA